MTTTSDRVEHRRGGAAGEGPFGYTRDRCGVGVTRATIALSSPVIHVPINRADVGRRFREVRIRDKRSEVVDNGVGITMGDQQGYGPGRAPSWVDQVDTGPRGDGRHFVPTASQVSRKGSAGRKARGKNSGVVDTSDVVNIGQDRFQESHICRCTLACRTSPSRCASSTLSNRLWSDHGVPALGGSSCHASRGFKGRCITAGNMKIEDHRYGCSNSWCGIRSRYKERARYATDGKSSRLHRNRRTR